MYTTTQLLKDALELIRDERKWCEGSVHNMRGQRCALGALYHASGSKHSGLIHVALRELRQAMLARVHKDVSSVYDPYNHNTVHMVGNSRLPSETVIAALNNTQGHKFVVESFKDAIRDSL